MKNLLAFTICFFLLSLCIKPFGGQLLGSQQSQDVERKITVTVMVCQEGDTDLYRAFENLPALIKELAKEYNWEVVVLTSERFVDFPSVEVLDRTDVLVVFVRRIALPTEQMQRVKRFVNESGKGLIAIRTASHGFAPRQLPEGCEDWQEFDKDVLGGNYNGHGHNDVGSEIWNVRELEQSPIMRDVRPSIWRSGGSVYYTAPVADDVTVYQYAASSERGRMPLTWTRMHGNTRVAYTALGHRSDFEVPAFKALMRNLVHWAADK
jgi:type 1 glutamine amidotransferase